MKPVIIIGAGPAGSAAAITLANADIPVILMERLDFPRFRPGETLHPGIEPLFERLGVMGQINTVDCIRHSGNRFIQRDGCEIFNSFNDTQQDWRGFQIPRAQLDTILRDAAINTGATLIQPQRGMELISDATGNPVGVRYDSHAQACSYLIDASGQAHWLTRKLGIEWVYHSPRLLATYGYVSVLNEEIRQWYAEPVFQELANGWLWVALVEQDRIAWVRLDKEQLNQEIPECLSYCQPVGKVHSADVTWRIASQVSGSGWMLSGDAAAVLDPSSSHGVLKAIMSGMMCGHLLKAMVRNSRHESEIMQYYDEWIRSWFFTDVRQLKTMTEPSRV